ncbi:MAG TPA: hypothetical protein VEY69_14500 [Lautropia sp.]|nr:hypothetical protein [Lautropia sp.]
MSDRQLTVSLAADRHAVLIVPPTLTPESLVRLEQGLAGVLGELRHEVSRGTSAPGEIEYASWMHHLRPARP